MVVDPRQLMQANQRTMPLSGSVSYVYTSSIPTDRPCASQNEDVNLRARPQPSQMDRPVAKQHPTTRGTTEYNTSRCRHHLRSKILVASFHGHFTRSTRKRAKSQPPKYTVGQHQIPSPSPITATDGQTRASSFSYLFHYQRITIFRHGPRHGRSGRRLHVRR